jgi:hypothetical protein
MADGSLEWQLSQNGQALRLGPSIAPLDQLQSVMKPTTLKAWWTQYNSYEPTTGWPDEFVKNIAQNVAQDIFVKINA